MQLSAAPGAKSYEEWIQQLNAAYGMDKSLLMGYLTWFGQAITGNFGDSWKYTVPVVEKFNDVIWLSFVMGAIAFVLELIIAIPLGVIAATKQYSKTDYAVTAGALIGLSLPTFFFATILKLVFSVKLGWFDLYGLVGRDYAQLSSWGQFWDKANHLVLPIVTLVIVSVGLIDAIYPHQYAGGTQFRLHPGRLGPMDCRNSKVIYHQAFRNTLIPLVTIIGGSLPSLFSGALITETLFSIPGIGWTSYQAIIAGDIPFSMFYMTFLAILTLLGNLISDVLYAVVDPRVRIA